MSARRIGIGIALAAAAAAAFSGCGGGKPVLHLYNWSDYMSPDLIPEFEKKFGCRVVADLYDSNEAMYAKIQAGAAGYDLIVPSSYMVSIMNQQGLLQPIDHAKVPNLKHVDRSLLKFTMDPEMHHSVPYMVGSTGFGYLKSKVPEFEPSWAVFNSTNLAGRMTLLNDMREVVGAALKFLGYSLNTTNEQELAQARDVVIGWKHNIAKFESDQYKNGLVSAEFLLCHGYSGDVMQVMEENEDVAYAVPREGTSIASDDLVIPRDARQVDLAHAFINFVHEPEVAARNIEYVFYRCPNTAAYALLDEEVRQDPAVFIPDEVIARSEVIRDLGEMNARYTKVWDEIKAAK